MFRVAGLWVDYSGLGSSAFGLGRGLGFVGWRLRASGVGTRVYGLGLMV